MLEIEGLEEGLMFILLPKEANAKRQNTAYEIESEKCRYRFGHFHRTPRACFP